MLFDICTESGKSSECGSNYSRHLANTYCQRSHHSLTQSVTVIKHIRAYYQTDLGYRSYHLSARSHEFDGDATIQIAKMTWPLEVHLKSQMVDGLHLWHPWYLLRVPKGMQHQRDSWRYWDVDIPLFQETAGAALSAPTCLSRSSLECQEYNLTSYCYVVNNFLATFATDDITAKAGMYIIKLK